LNPDDAIKRYKGGIDMDYMVGLVGGEYVPTTEGNEPINRFSGWDTSIKGVLNPLCVNSDDDGLRKTS